mgnify:CR=1 FL=1
MVVSMPKYCYTCKTEFFGDMELHRNQIHLTDYAVKIVAPNGFERNGIYTYIESQRLLAEREPKPIEPTLNEPATGQPIPLGGFKPRQRISAISADKNLTISQ